MDGSKELVWEFCQEARQTFFPIFRNAVDRADPSIHPAQPRPLPEQGLGRGLATKSRLLEYWMARSPLSLGTCFAGHDNREVLLNLAPMRVAAT